MRKLTFATILVLAIVLGLGPAEVARADVLIEYSADAGSPQSAEDIQSPVEQGWVETGTGTDATGEGVVDNGTNAWKIVDNASSFNPRYGWFLTAEDFRAMYDQGWELVFVARSLSAGFCGWGVTTATDPGWGLTGRERVGFGIVVTGVNAFQATPEHGSQVVLGPNSANDFHTIRCVGQPQSSQYEFFIDGVSYGTFDIK